MRRCAVAVALLLLTVLPAVGSAALFTHNASASPGSNPDAGSVNVWLVSLSTGDSSKAGSFQGNSAGNGDGNGAGAGATAWAMYANSGNTATATTTAFSTLSDVSLINLHGQFISLDFDNGFVHNASESGQGVGGSVGISFRNNSNAEVFGFRFLGGNSFYQFTDSANPSFANTTKGFTDDGFNTKLELTNNTGGYTFTFGGSTVSGTLKTLSKEIASIVVFNNFAGPGGARNLYFDHLQLSTSAVPEVSAVLAIPVSLAVTGLGVGFVRRVRARISCAI